MKKIIETIPKEFYEADDGERFTRKTDCEEYERKINQKAKIEKLAPNLVLEGFPPLNCEWINQEFEKYSWYIVHNEQDRINMVEAFGIDIPEIEKYPEHVCVTYSESDEYFVEATRLSDSISQAINMFNKFGYDTIVSMRGNKS